MGGQAGVKGIQKPRQPVAKPAPKKTVAKKKAAPAPQPDLKSLKQEPLSKEDYEMVIDSHQVSIQSYECNTTLYALRIIY